MNILTVGASGYAKLYIAQMLDNTDADLHWAGIVDPYFDRCEHKAQIESRGIPVFDTMEAFYASGRTADFATIATPHFLHAEQSIYSLQNGADVLCEKPAAPTVEQAERMAQAEQDTGHFIAIGYQWSFSDAIRHFKRDMASGLFGRPVQFKSYISWPRSAAYYSRTTGWAGKLRMGDIPVSDSVLTNACSHFLHNMLFLLGDRPETAADISFLAGECYRANPIESYDTCSLSMTANGVPLYLVASHATGIWEPPAVCLSFEAGKAYYIGERKALIFRRHDGTERDYGDPFADPARKFRESVQASMSKTRPVCTVQTALPQVRVCQRVQNEIPVRSFPDSLIRTEPSTQTRYVEGLHRRMQYAYENCLMLSEAAESI